MTTTPPTAQPAPDKREAILEAALHLFVERGFYGTAVPEVARRARVAAGTIYNYFPSKEALVNALFRKWKEALARRVYTAFPMTAPPREQFEVMWREMAAFALAHPQAFAFLELHHHRPYLDAESCALQNQLKDFAKGVCKQAQDVGAFKAMDTTLLMELLFGAFIGMMRAHWDGGVELDEQAIAHARGACWDMVAL
jgi:AcrR family transcriptional regulator